MREKRQLYFEAGAREVWICDESGSLRFFTSGAATEPASISSLCPAFPTII
jgi:hypothetical protein